MGFEQVSDEGLYEGPGKLPSQSKEGLYIRFYHEPIFNRLKSEGGIRVKDGKEEVVEGAGRPIFDDVEYIEIVIPGDRNNIINRAVTQQDKRQWAQQYQAWKAGDQEQLSGTPLDKWPGIHRAQVEELKYFRVRTVEQLAEMGDGVIGNIGPILGLRQRARDFLAAAKGAAPLESLRAQMVARENENEVLRRQAAEAVQRMDEMSQKLEQLSRAKGK